MSLLHYGNEWSRDRTASLNCSRIGRTTTLVGSLLHCTTTKLIEIKRSVNLARQGGGCVIRVGCRKYDGIGMSIDYFVERYQSRIGPPLLQ